jgi:hypothetical protein
MSANCSLEGSEPIAVTDVGVFTVHLCTGDLNREKKKDRTAHPAIGDSVFKARNQLSSVESPHTGRRPSRCRACGHIWQRPV